MSFLHKDALFLKSLRKAPGAAQFVFEFDTDQQAFAADILDVFLGDFFKVFHDILTHFAGIFHQVLFFDDLQSRDGYRSTQRITTKGGSMLTGFDQTQDVFICQNCGDRIEAA